MKSANKVHACNQCKSQQTPSKALTDNDSVFAGMWDNLDWLNVQSR